MREHKKKDKGRREHMRQAIRVGRKIFGTGNTSCVGGL